MNKNLKKHDKNLVAKKIIINFASNNKSNR